MGVVASRSLLPPKGIEHRGLGNPANIVKDFAFILSSGNLNINFKPNPFLILKSSDDNLRSGHIYTNPCTKLLQHIDLALTFGRPAVGSQLILIPCPGEPITIRTHSSIDRGLSVTHSS